MIASSHLMLASEGMVESHRCCGVYGTDCVPDHKPLEMRFHLPADSPQDRMLRLEFEISKGKLWVMSSRHAPPPDITNEVAENEREGCATHFTRVATEGIQSR